MFAILSRLQQQCEHHSHFNVRQESTTTTFAARMVAWRGLGWCENRIFLHCVVSHHAVYIVYIYKTKTPARHIAPYPSERKKCVRNGIKCARATKHISACCKDMAAKCRCPTECYNMNKRTLMCLCVAPHIPEIDIRIMCATNLTNPQRNQMNNIYSTLYSNKPRERTYVRYSAVICGIWLV